MSLVTFRLALDPLRVEDAEAMVGVLGDPALYRYTGGVPPTLPELHQRYAHQVAGPTSPGSSAFRGRDAAMRPRRPGPSSPGWIGTA